MFRTRLISSIVLVALALGAIVPGGDVLFIVLLIVSLKGLNELYRALGIHKSILGYAGYAMTIFFYLFLRFGLSDDLFLLGLGFLIFIMGIYVFTFPKFHFSQVAFSFMGVYYVPVMLSFIYQTRMLKDGIFIVWLIFLCSWGCDTCAYASGMLFGKHKLAPVLSPKKSIEGAIGGIFGSAVLGAVYGAVFAGKHIGDINPTFSYAVICGLGSVIAQVGDLAASAIKRNYDIKDYGKLIPGHGGILDRFDSVIFTSPVIFFLATVLV